MIVLLVIAALSVAALAATATALVRDGYRARRTDPARIPDREPVRVSLARVRHTRSGFERHVRVRVTG